MSFKHLFRQVCPPIILTIVQSLLSRLSPSSHLHLTGNYTTWEEATQASTGYDSDLILEKTKQALLQVKNGEAIYERDSVLFDDIQYSWPLLTGLMWAAARSGGRLNVLDFGGSLGSTYFQNREFLRGLTEVRWNIVEQPKHVKVGKEFFEDEILRFYPDIEEYSKNNSPDVIVLSSVLQYLENPYEILDLLIDLSSFIIIIDMTPFWNEGVDRLCVQHVPTSIYDASYPCWVFSKLKFYNLIETKCLNILVDSKNGYFLPGTVDNNYHAMILCRNLLKWSPSNHRSDL